MPASSSALRVHRDHVAAARDEHRIVRRHRVELVARRHPAFCQDAFVPAGRGHHPFAGFRARDALADRLSARRRPTSRRAAAPPARSARRTADADACRSGPAPRSCRQARSPACSARYGRPSASSLPTARKRPSRIATPSATRQSLSTVITLPPRSTRSAGCARAGEARRARRQARRNAWRAPCFRELALHASAVMCAQRVPRIRFPLPKGSGSPPKAAGRGDFRCRCKPSPGFADCAATLSRKRERGESAPRYFTNVLPVIRSRFL